MCRAEEVLILNNVTEELGVSKSRDMVCTSVECYIDLGVYRKHVITSVPSGLTVISWRWKSYPFTYPFTVLREEYVGRLDKKCGPYYCRCKYRQIRYPWAEDVWEPGQGFDPDLVECPSRYLIASTTES